MKLTSFYIMPALREQVQAICDRYGLSLGAVIRQALVEYIERRTV